MIVQIARPGPPLSGFVECFWHCEGPPPGHPAERILPQLAPQLLINLGDDTISAYEDDPARRRVVRGPAVGGVHVEPFVIATAQQATTMGVAFLPGRAGPLLGVPLGELQGRHEPLEALWGPREASRLRDRLHEAGTPGARFALLERALLGRLLRHDRPAGPSPAVALALEELGRVPRGRPIAELADRAVVSHRHLIRLFRDEVGLAPKQFARLRRFQAVLARVGRGRPVDWAAVALACGYADQSHLIRDFRAFAGLGPTAYHALRGDEPNHVPMPE
jgi:AraC-like DNA-binding protein